MNTCDLFLYLGVLYAIGAAVLILLGFGPKDTLQDRVANLWRGAVTFAILAIAIKVVMG